MQRIEPTPEEIAERAAEVREEWSEAEHYRRSGFRAPAWLGDAGPVPVAGWHPPEVRVTDDVSVSAPG